MPKVDYKGTICNIQAGNNLKVHCLQKKKVYTGYDGVIPCCVREEGRCRSELQGERNTMRKRRRAIAKNNYITMINNG